MKSGHFKVAEAYILFRADRANARTTGTDDTLSAEVVTAIPAVESAAQASLIVLKHADGTNTFWDGTDLRKRIEFARIGLDLCLSNDEIEGNVRAEPMCSLGLSGHCSRGKHRED